MRVAVNSHALTIYKKNRIASLLCIFETTIRSNKTTPYQCLRLTRPNYAFMRCRRYSNQKVIQYMQGFVP